MPVKKSVIFILILAACCSLFASMIPVNGFNDDSIFDSPALLAITENGSVPFGVELKGYADMDMINFLSNPGAALNGVAEGLRNFLLNQDDQYLFDNYDVISSIFNFDPQFPSAHSDLSENAYYIKNYLNNRYDLIGAGNKVRAIYNALDSNLGFMDDSSTSFGGELDFSMRMHGGAIKNGFGWDWNLGIVYDGVSSILSSSSYENHKYGSDFYFTLGSNLGYGTYISDNFAIGISFSPDFVFKTTIDNTALFASRISGSLIDLVGGGNFNFGASLKMNLGFLIDAGEEAKILIDFRNLPSMQMYWYFSADDIVSEKFQLHEDDNIYFVPPDVSLGLVWDKGPWHVEGEISNIADQLIWKAMIPSYMFDILSVPKLSFAYRILDDMSIGLGYEFRSVVLSFMWSGLKAEFSTRVDKLGFGITLGYEF